MHKFFLLMLALAAAAAQANPLQDELLEPEKAFQASVRAIDGETVEAQWKIADGYYLYRDKFKFEALDDGVIVKDVRIPPGTRKHDEFFGDVETYRKQVKVIVKLGRNDPAARDLKLKVTSQGCADVGVCYPPQTQTVNLKLAAVKASANPPPTAKPDSLASLGNLVDPNADQEFLEPDRAFQLSVVDLDANTLLARFDIAPGYYLYRDKTRFQLSANSGAKLGAYELPRGKVKVDEFFGKTEVYYDRVEVKLPLMQAADVKSLELTANYQGCADKGICYPPITKKLSVAVGAANAGAATPAGSVDAPTTTPAPKFWVAVLSAFGIGLLLTFTPCVLPMIPILSSIIVGQGGQNISKLRGGLLSGAYVLGTAVTYTIAGVVAGATGDQLQAYFQNAWAIGIFSALFVLLALSMFGFYELQMPSFVQSRLQERAQTLKGGSYLGVFIMGLLSALIVGACVSPLLISALGVAISSKDPVLGGAIMFAMSLGMGVILIAIGVGAGFLLPRAGAWMNTVKYVFGVLLLAVAIYLLGVLPQVPVMYLWAALFIVSGVYLGATQTLPKDAGGWSYLWKGVGTLLIIWGVAALIGAFYGQRDILKPLPAALTGAASSAISPASIANAVPAGALFHLVATLKEFDDAFAAARAANRPIVVDFYATWCTDCVRMEKSTFSDPRVRQALAGFALIQADVTENNDESRKIKQKLSVLGPPAMLFFDKAGSERKELRFYGYKDADEFLAVLAKL